jgi:hypothetical protein
MATLHNLLAFLHEEVFFGNPKPDALPTCGSPYDDVIAHPNRYQKIHPYKGH